MGRHKTRLVLGLVLFLACDDDEQVERYPIQAFMLQYGDPVLTCVPNNPQPGYIQVGAVVGHVGCDLESAEVEVRGDSLIVTGVARCVFRRRSKPLTPPARLNPQMLTIQLPELDAGTYTLCADGLCGEVLVTTACRPAIHGELHAYGAFATWDSCLVFATDHGFRFFEAMDLEPPTFGARVRIFGAPWCSMPWCAEICAGSLDGVVRVWSVEPLIEPHDSR